MKVKNEINQIKKVHHIQLIFYRVRDFNSGYNILFLTLGMLLSSLHARRLKSKVFKYNVVPSIIFNLLDHKYIQQFLLQFLIFYSLKPNINETMSS